MNDVDKVLTAVYRRDIPALQRFSSQQINSIDEDGRTPLMHAVLSEKGDAALVKSLVELGADTNLPDKEQRWTALHFAARDQKEEIVRALLDSGANVNVSNVFGNTPLLEALTHASPNLTIIRDLLEHGADPGHKNNYGVTALQLARQMGRPDLVSVLQGWKTK